MYKPVPRAYVTPETELDDVDVELEPAPLVFENFKSIFFLANYQEKQFNKNIRVNALQLY